MKIELSSKTEHGTNRGGEDLFFVVKATSKVEPSPDVLKAVFEAAWQACLAALPTDSGEEDIWLDSEEFENGATTEPELRSHASECYDFAIAYSLSEARAKVEKTVLEGDWVKRLKTGTYEVSKEFYVDGNAD